MASILDALLGRVPPNGGQGSVPMTGGQFRPQNAPLGGPGSSAGMRYNYPNPRAEAAGYTTSSAFPGAPAGPPTDMSVAGPWGAGMGAGMGPPATTGAIGGGGVAPRGPGPAPLPPPIPPELINPNLNVQTPTSVPNPVEFNATSPSSLGSFLPVAQSPSSLGEALPVASSPSSVTPPFQRTVQHPPSTKTGKQTASDERFGGDKTASTKKPSTKKGGRLKSQYALMKERRSNK